MSGQDFTQAVPNSTRDDADTALWAAPRKRAWTVAMVEAAARARGTTPEGRLLAIFDVLDDLVNRADRDAREFVEMLSHTNRPSALDRAGSDVLLNFRVLIATLATEAELRDVSDLTLSWRVLMTGAIVKAVEGDLDAPRRARAMAVDLITRYRVVGRQPGPVVALPVDVASGDDIQFDLEFELDYEDPTDRRVRRAILTADTDDEIALHLASINDLQWALA